MQQIEQIKCESAKKLKKIFYKNIVRFFLKGPLTILKKKKFFFFFL
jgi:hypothetical protein